MVAELFQARDSILQDDDLDLESFGKKKKKKKRGDLNLGEDESSENKENGKGTT